MERGGGGTVGGVRRGGMEEENGGIENIRLICWQAREGAAGCMYEVLPSPGASMMV